VGFDEQDLNHHSDALYKELIGGLNDHPNSVLKVLNEPDLNIDASHKRYLRSRALSHTNRDQEALLELDSLIMESMEFDSLKRLALRAKSLIQYRAGDYHSFINTTHRVFEFDSLSSELTSASNDLSNISTGYHNLGEFKRALQFQKRAYNMAVRSQDSSLINLQMRDFIPILLEIGKLDSAEMLLAQFMDKEANSKYEYLTNLINYGSIFNKRGAYKESKDVYLEALDLAKELGDSSDIALVLNNIAYANFHLGNATEAFVQLDSVHDYYERQNRIDFARNIGELELKYEDLERDGKLVELELQSKADRNFKLGLSIVALLIISILGAFFWNYRTRLNNLRTLRTEEQKRFQKEKELAAIHSSMQALDEERKRVAMDLNDGIGVLASAARIRVSQVNTRLKDDDLNVMLTETDEVLQEITSDVRRIARNIMPPTLSKLGLKAALEELVEKGNESLDIEFEMHLDDVQFPTGGHQDITLYRISQELINNALKHSQATSVTLTLKDDGRSILLAYEDNGVGLNTDLNNENGSGLNAMRSRIESIGGTMSIDERRNDGTHMRFELKYAG